MASREAGRGAELAAGIAQVASGLVHERQAAGVAVLFSREVERSELEPRAAHGLLANDALPDVRLDQLLEVQRELLVELLLDGRALEERPQPQHPIGQHRAPLLPVQHLRHGVAQLTPALDFDLQLAAAALGEFVVLGASVVVGRAPVRAYETAPLEPVERRARAIPGGR